MTDIKKGDIVEYKALPGKLFLVETEPFLFGGDLIAGCREVVKSGCGYKAKTG